MCPPVHALFVDHHQAKQDGEVPQAMLKYNTGLLFAADAPEAPSSTYADEVGHECGGGEAPCGEARQGEEDRADGGEEEGVAQGHECVLAGVEGREHGVACLCVGTADDVGEGVEVGKLPGVEEHEECEGSEGVVDEGEVDCGDGGEEVGEEEVGRVGGGWEEGASTCSPAHDGGDGANDGADPSADNAAALGPGVDAGVEGNVGGAEDGGSWIYHGQENGRAGEARDCGEGCGVERSECATDERAHAGAGHLGIERDFLELVEGVGRGTAEGGADCGGEKDGNGGRERREGDTGHGRKHD
ncbi:hypothetical protein D9615_004228 [Tricholomella constricta]|uniref:Uncharacterized protein n=1 Tax=Tricholomella constricta TaxID=117010 RepID=A0A8H5HER6_9AGAR|nr:hypothetical protein D9615_004228 [Tricholomella constricta]